MTASKIIVTTDFSEQAEVALQHAMSLARHSGSEVILMHALSMPYAGFSMPYPVAIPGLYQDQVKEIQVDARNRLEEQRERFLGQGVEMSHVFLDEVADRGVVSAAADSKANLIVVGSHGRTGLTRFLLGSVAERIVRRAECDVLVARGTAPAGGYKRILVPTDFSEMGDRAVACATELVAPDGIIDVLHCWQLPGRPVTYWGAVGPGLRESIQLGAIDFGKKCTDKFTGISAEMTFTSEEADPRHSIEKREKSGDYDLIVMGSHGRKGLNRFLLGSVTESTLRHVGVSVYVVRTAA